ncbi:MAG: hypothetical protein HGB11_10545 [Chlorobiales bacterium]|nr:hypothetical protein [Chlorobiales bacterium]
MSHLEEIEAVEECFWTASDILRANSNCDSNEYFLSAFSFKISHLHTAPDLSLSKLMKGEGEV